MITPDEAIDIRDHLIAELERTGYGDIVREVIIRLEENPEREAFEQSHPGYFLTYFLAQVIDVFETISNDHYENLLNKLSEYVSTENGHITEIQVELIVQDHNQPEFFNLRDLPSYNGIIEMLKEIQQEINSEN